uniref:Tyrosine-protein phosphatase domain-containing protein n=1 Tax=Steinernema glaseri TaxID=37863 RepID=A0A1I8AT43_9BILA
MATKSLMMKPMSRRKSAAKTPKTPKEELNNEDGTQIEQKQKGRGRGGDSRQRVKIRIGGATSASASASAPTSACQDQLLRAFCIDTTKTGVAKLVKDFNETRAASLKATIARTAFDKNMDKNRYKDVVCGDEGRVVLTWPPGHPNDYIHANW